MFKIIYIIQFFIGTFLSIFFHCRPQDEINTVVNAFSLELWKEPHIRETEDRYATPTYSIGLNKVGK